jgi:hypothetical protein
VVWKALGAKSPRAHPIQGALNKLYHSAILEEY